MRHRAPRHTTERSAGTSPVLLMSMARILITGATGSLGRRVATRAVAAGHTVIGTHVRPWIQAGRGPAETVPGRSDQTGGSDARGPAGRFDAAISPVRLDIRDLE